MRQKFALPFAMEPEFTRAGIRAPAAVDGIDARPAVQPVRCLPAAQKVMTACTERATGDPAFNRFAARYRR